MLFIWPASKRQFSEFCTRPTESNCLHEGLKILHFNKLPRRTLNFEHHCLKENTFLIWEFYKFETLTTKFSLIGSVLVNFPETCIFMKSGCRGIDGETCLFNCIDLGSFPCARYCVKELGIQIRLRSCLQGV